MKSLRNKGRGFSGQRVFDIPQIIRTALKIFRLSQHGNRRGTIGGINFGDIYRIEIRTNNPFGRRGLFHFGNEPDFITAQGSREIQRRRLYRRSFFNFSQRNEFFLCS
jgi:hypothetical protein